jgi:uncharacterized protein (TIGR03067 family)
MKKQIVILLSVLVLAVACAPHAYADELDALAGKWTCHNTNEDGQRYTQHMEIKKNKFTFRVVNGDETRLYAEGDVKLDKAGPFKSISFTNIKAGQSASDANPIDDTYTSIYTMGDDGAFLVAMNFDKDRDSQKPRLDVYRKDKTAAKSEAKPEAK